MIVLSSNILLNKIQVRVIQLGYQLPYHCVLGFQFIIFVFISYVCIWKRRLQLLRVSSLHLFNAAILVCRACVVTHSPSCFILPHDYCIWLQWMITFLFFILVLTDILFFFLLFLFINCAILLLALSSLLSSSLILAAVSIFIYYGLWILLAHSMHFDLLKSRLVLWSIWTCTFC